MPEAGIENRIEKVVVGQREMVVKAHIFGKTDLRSLSTGQSQIVDPFSDMYAADKILRPPYNPQSLAQVSEISPSLSQCVSAMITNVGGFGWELIPAPHVSVADELPKEAEVEKQKVDNLFNYCNRQENFTILRKDVRLDYDLIGMGYMEVVRNRANEIAELHRLPSYLTRLTIRDGELTEFKQPIRNAHGKFEEIVRRDRFRRIVQVIDANKKVYFKEFGDPRMIDADTGELNPSTKNPANEVIVFSQPCAYGVYGLPVWLPDLMGILGARKAETVNYMFFDNKTIPPMVVTVSGGSLTKGTVDKLTELFEKEIKGLDNFHQALIIEATPTDMGGDMPGEKMSPVRIHVQPLTQFIAKDGQFLNYLAAVDGSVGASFRLPPIYRGKSKDYTRATAMESARVGEEQVFVPERRQFDYIINTTILADMKINYWNFRSLGAKTADHAAIVRSMGAVKEGATVGAIQEAVAEMRGIPVGEISEELKDMTLAELMRSPGIVEVPTEGEGSEEGGNVEKFIEGLIQVRQKLRKRLVEKEGVD